MQARKRSNKLPHHGLAAPERCTPRPAPPRPPAWAAQNELEARRKAVLDPETGRALGGLPGLRARMRLRSLPLEHRMLNCW